MLELVLVVATILGGLAAIWYFAENITKRRSARPTAGQQESSCALPGQAGDGATTEDAGLRDATDVGIARQLQHLVFRSTNRLFEAMGSAAFTANVDEAVLRNQPLRTVRHDSDGRPNSMAFRALEVFVPEATKAQVKRIVACLFEIEDDAEHLLILHGPRLRPQHYALLMDIQRTAHAAAILTSSIWDQIGVTRERVMRVIERRFEEREEDIKDHLKEHLRPLVEKFIELEAYVAPHSGPFGL